MLFTPCLVGLQKAEKDVNEGFEFPVEIGEGVDKQGTVTDTVT